MSFNHAVQLAYLSFLFLVSCYALLRGRRPEKIGALTVLLATLLTSGARLSGLASWDPTGIVVPLIDVGTMVTFYWLAISTTRFWPIWCFGFLLANVFITVAAALLPGVGWFFYASGVAIYAYLTIGAVGIGAFQASRRPGEEANDGFR